MMPEPYVGIFFLVGGKLVFEATRFSEAGTYAHCKIHEGDHVHYWDKLLRDGAVLNSEYDEYPRGRVVFDTKIAQFTIYADRCILANKRLVAKITRELNLPMNTKIETDPHYRCPKCMKN